MTRRGLIRLHKPGTAETATGTSRDLPEIASWDKATFWLTITAVAGTGSFQAFIEEKDPNTTTEWADAGAGHPGRLVTFTAITEAGPFPNVQRNAVSPITSRRIRLSWTITGLTSVTFGVTAVVSSEEG